jgi:hypothetical protein
LTENRPWAVSGAKVFLSKIKGELVEFQVNAIVEQGDEQDRLTLKFFDVPIKEAPAPEEAVVVECPGKGTLWRLTAKLIAIEFDRPGPNSSGRLILHPPHERQQVQRRRFYRLSVSMPLRWIPVQLPAGYAGDILRRRTYAAEWTRDVKTRGMTGNSSDISACGFSYATDLPPFKGDDFFFELSLPDGPLRVAARAVRIMERNVPNEASHLIGLRFIGLEPRDESRLVNFLFREEGRLRRKAREEP